MRLQGISVSPSEASCLTLAMEAVMYVRRAKGHFYQEKDQKEEDMMQQEIKGSAHVKEERDWLLPYIRLVVSLVSILTGAFWKFSQNIKKRK